MSAIAHTPQATVAAELDPLDLYNVRSMLSDEERLVQDSVGKFVDDKVIPIIGECFEEERFPRELIPAVAELGLLGSSIHGYGCAGLNAVAYGLICQELERGDSGLRSFVSVQSSLCMYPIHAFGSEAQREKFLPRMATGELIGCFGLTEPDFGSDPSRMRTRAEKRGDSWVLNGTKMWITNGGIADIAIVWANTEEGVRGFIVPTDAEGFTANNIHRKLSLRASVTSELVLENVELSDAHVLPGVTGMKGPLSCLSEARYGIVWGAMGAARACLESALDYSKARVQFGKPIAAFQLTQEKLANMALELEKGTLLALHLGRMKDEGRLRPEHVSVGKLNNVREALAIAREARTILGASGITLEYPVIRHMNNLESVLTYEGTSEIHTLVIGQALTGERAFD
jgi:glutaryl-CoA dehydrogenase